MQLGVAARIPCEGKLHDWNVLFCLGKAIDCDVIGYELVYLYTAWAEDAGTLFGAGLRRGDDDL
jgi:hypothetical protein